MRALTKAQKKRIGRIWRRRYAWLREQTEIVQKFVAESRERKMPHEYRVKTTDPFYGDMSGPTYLDPKLAGKEFRENRKNHPDKPVELQKRTVEPWETVERSEPV